MKFIAIDLGASSGRVIVGELQSDKIKLTDVHRFPNSGHDTIHGLHWDLIYLFEEIIKGLGLARNKFGAEFDSIGIDSWGLDYVLLNSQKLPVLWPYHYRDKRTKNTQLEINKIVSKDTIFSTTGIQFMEINTINQLFATKKQFPEIFSAIRHFLMIPDYFTYLLTGKLINEFSNASTTQLLNVHTKEWAYNLLKKLDIPSTIFHPVTVPGTKISPLRTEIINKTKLSQNTMVMATASHDTAAAIAAVPCNMNSYNSGEWIYISSGTWSLIGVELENPVLSAKALDYNFTNEKGVNNSVHFLKNITGTWIIHECKKQWNKTYPSLTWKEITEQAEVAENFNIYIDIMHPDFINPEDMLETVLSHIQSFGSSIQPTIGQISRIIYESMVSKYCEVIQQIQDTTQIRAKIIHIVGGGSQIALLNQMIADRTQIPVISGPVEATSIGNILIQALGLGYIDNLSTIREIIRNSFPLDVYLPKIES